MMINEALSAPAESLKELANRILSELHQAVTFQEEGVLKREVEAVHQMRVASRRLRVALSNFAVCCVLSERRRTRAFLGRLAEALGGVRDLDVLIAALKVYKASLPPSEQGHVGALIRRLRARRLRRRHRLEAFLRHEDYICFKREFPSLIQTSLAVDQQTERQEDYGQGA